MKTVHKIALVALLWLILLNPGSISIVDTERRLQMAHAWWTGKEERIPGDGLVIKVNDRAYIPYDLGQSMLMLPADWLGTQIGRNLATENQRQQLREAIVSFGIFLPLNLLAVLACFHLLKLFGYSDRLSGLSTVVWLLGTSFLFYTTYHQQNNQILLLTTLSYIGALKYVIEKRKKWAILSGIALGVGFLIRMTVILYAICAIAFLIGCLWDREQKISVSKSLKAIAFWLIGYVPFLVIERILSYVRYGSWIATSTSLHLQIYSKGKTITQADSIIRGNSSDFSFLYFIERIEPGGILKTLFSPEKSLFLYDPLFLPCLLLLLICWKFLSGYVRWYLVTAIAGLILHLCLYSRTSDWFIHPDWGARYHITSVHLFLIPLIPLLVRGATTKFKKRKHQLERLVSGIAKITIVFAIAIQLAAVVLPPDLEATQQRLGFGSRWRVVQRLKNIYYITTYEQKPHPQISKLFEHSLGLAPQKRISWYLFPLKLQERLEANSAVNKILPFLLIFWSLIFVLAIASTVWLVVSS